MRQALIERSIYHVLLNFGIISRSVETFQKVSFQAANASNRKSIRWHSAASDAIRRHLQAGYLLVRTPSTSRANYAHIIYVPGAQFLNV